MVNAWYMDGECIEQRSEPQSSQYISAEDLNSKTGVEYFKLDLNSEDVVLEKMMRERGYFYGDELACSKECAADADKLKSFAVEHLHADEEIRVFTDGTGYFDVRDGADRWIRIAVSAGDMIVLPSGIYHRFSIGPDNFVKLKRYFSQETEWVAANRPADELACRRQYLSKLQRGFATSGAS